MCGAVRTPVFRATSSSRSTRQCCWKPWNRSQPRHARPIGAVERPKTRKPHRDPRVGESSPGERSDLAAFRRVDSTTRNSGSIGTCVSPAWACALHCMPGMARTLWQNWLVPGGKLAAKAYDDWLAHGAAELAASLAYYTIF